MYLPSLLSFQELTEEIFHAIPDVTQRKTLVDAVISVLGMVTVGEEVTRGSEQNVLM